MRRHVPIFLSLFVVWILTSCTKTLVISDVTYQSVRTSFAKPDKLPERAVVGVEYFINPKGVLLPIVYNLTDDIITIDQTKSFLVNTNGESISYYDPTIKSSTSGSFESSTSGTSFNLGAIANAFGIGGPLGSLMGGTTLSSSSTAGSFYSNTVTVVDQPLVRIGPKGRIVMSKQFNIYGVGDQSKGLTKSTYVDSKYKDAPLRFSVTICYTREGYDELQKLTTDFYVNSSIVEPVNKGDMTTAFSSIYTKKPDALAEPLHMFFISSNFPKDNEFKYYEESIKKENIFSTYGHGSLIDYK